MLKSLIKSLMPRPAAAAAPAGAELERCVEEATRRALLELLGVGSGASQPPDYERIARIMAGVEAARYMTDHMQDAVDAKGRGDLLAYALDQAKLDGLVLEFGVFRGESLRFIAQRSTGLVHGFDSFEGLPEHWTYFQRKGRFSLDGKIPEFEEENVRIHPGLFGDTLRPFLAQNEGVVRFLHVDSDLYSSAAQVLGLLAPRLVPGSVILFDEYINYPAWRQHEYKAFQEFIAARGLGYRYIGFASTYMSVAVQLV